MCVRMSFHHYCHIVFMNTCAIDPIQDHHIRKQHLNPKKVFIFFLSYLETAFYLIFFCSINVLARAKQKKKKSDLKVPK